MPTRNFVANQAWADPPVIDVQWVGLLNTDDGSPFEWNRGFAERDVTVSGTFGVGGTLVMQGSNDAVTWRTLRTVAGTASFTAAGGGTLTEYPRFIRPLVTAGDGTTSLVVRMFQSGLRNVSAANPQSNFGATANPGATDDAAAGYGTGSLWLNLTTDLLWVCQSPAIGAAVWSPLDAADTPGPISGGVYPVAPQMGNGVLLGAADTAYAQLLPPDFAAALTTIGTRVTVAAGAGGLLKVAVLPHDTTTNRPGATALAANNVGLNTAATGQLLATLAAATAIVPGRPVWIVGVPNNVAPLATTVVVPTGLVLLAQQFGLGFPGAGVGAQPAGFSTPFPFANDISAANAFLGATWTAVNAGSMPAWAYQIA